MHRLADEVSPWAVIFADDIMICGESKEQVEESPRERRGMNVSRHTAGVCVSEGDAGGMAKAHERMGSNARGQSNGQLARER